MDTPTITPEMIEAGAAEIMGGSTFTHEERQEMARDAYLAMLASAPPPAAPDAVGVRALPMGAIVNGRILMDRLEQHYEFRDQQEHPLHNCGEWQDLRRCFEIIAEFAAAALPSAFPDAVVEAALDGFRRNVDGTLAILDRPHAMSFQSQMRRMRAALKAAALSAPNHQFDPVDWESVHDLARVRREAVRLWDEDNPDCGWSRDNRDCYMIRAALTLRAKPTE